MKSRCANPKVQFYHRYGGRGIKVCEEWLNDVEAFYRHVGDPPSPLHSIDRIDPDGNYEPGNVRWATQSIQCKNRTPKKPILCNGKMVSKVEAHKQTGLSIHILDYYRRFYVCDVMEIAKYVLVCRTQGTKPKVSFVFKDSLREGMHDKRNTRVRNLRNGATS